MGAVHIRESALVLLIVAASVAVACGGSSDEGAGKGTRVTDPTLVATSTPIQNPLVYRYQGDQISTQGGPSGSATSVPASQAAGRTHTVRPGETCAGIAAAEAVTVEDLLKANRAINAECTNLREGDVLKIPGKTSSPGTLSTATPRPGGARTYTVKSGDTCAGIAQSYSVSVPDLISRNRLSADCAIKPGQELTIP